MPGGAESTAERVFTVDVLPAGHGTSLWIEYGDARATRRLLVDGGPRQTAPELTRRLEALDPADRRFELVIATHLDEQNVGDLLGLFERAYEARRRGEPEPFTSDDVWTNASALISPPPSLAKLLDRLAPLGVPVNRAFDGNGVVRTTPLTRVELAGGMSVTVLGPSQASLDRLRSRLSEGDDIGNEVL